MAVASLTTAFGSYKTAGSTNSSVNVGADTERGGGGGGGFGK